MQYYQMTVGADGSDLTGWTNRHIQAAVDHVAQMGGGDVVLSAGTFTLSNSVHLRNRVRLAGQGETTVLRKKAMVTSRVTTFHGYGHYDIAVEEPDLFHHGDGVWITDDNAGGFYTTVGTLVRRDGDMWFTDRPHSHDYLGANNAALYTLFPLISAYDVDDATVDSLALDGNKAENPVQLNGCRGGGVFAMRCNRITMRNLVIKDVNSEGISFQTCNDPEVAHCLVEGCTGNGYHPGSGSMRFHIHDCIARGNGECGLFYCLRVTDSLLEDCLFEGNGSHGISTGARDTDNINRNLTVRNNGGCGFFFRDDTFPNAAHRNVISGCAFTSNCQQDGTAEILLQGETDGTEILGNSITCTQLVQPIVIGPKVTGLIKSDNTIQQL